MLVQLFHNDPQSFIESFYYLCNLLPWPIKASIHCGVCSQYGKHIAEVNGADPLFSLLLLLPSFN